MFRDLRAHCGYWSKFYQCNCMGHYSLVAPKGSCVKKGLLFRQWLQRVNPFISDRRVFHFPCSLPQPLNAWRPQAPLLLWLNQEASCLPGNSAGGWPCSHLTVTNPVKMEHINAVKPFLAVSYSKQCPTPCRSGGPRLLPKQDSSLRPRESKRIRRKR